MSNYRVQFEVFEGPLDLLLHLVRKEEVDIYQINLTRIANEFVAYLEQMRELDLEVAGEFIVMAATLIYIKSRELLPKDLQVRPTEEEADGDDPRWELIRRLVEYKKFKDAAASLQSRESEMDLIYEHRPGRLELDTPEETRKPELSLFDLINAVSGILKRFNDRTDIREIGADPFTVSEKIEFLRTLAESRTRLRFSELFESARSRTEVVVTFLAMLELIRLKHIHATQAADFDDIEILLGPSTPPPAAEPPAPAGTPPSAEVPAPAQASNPQDPVAPAPAAPDNPPGTPTDAGPAL